MTMIDKTERVEIPALEGGKEWEVLIPTSPGRILRTETAARIKTLDGKRVGLFWNTKPNGDLFLIRVGERLKERFKDVKIVEFLPGKEDTTSAAPNTAINEASEKCDVVILSTGD
jgi:hypothetical protein